MDRHLFRGKRIDTGEWVVGSLLLGYWSNRYRKKIDVICVNDDELKKTSRYPIDPKTIGQCTGVKDINDILIFEGDKVKWTYKEFWWTALCSTYIPDPQSQALYYFELEHNCSEDGETSSSRKGIRNEINFRRNVEIIGNIHDEQK